VAEGSGRLAVLCGGPRILSWRGRRTGRKSGSCGRRFVPADGQAKPSRSWYRKKRFLIPIGGVVVLILIGICAPDPVPSVKAADASTAAVSGFLPKRPDPAAQFEKYTPS
jgi:hypothetical protein